MKLHYKGPYNSDPASLPHGEHKPNAVPFREAKDMKTLSQITNIGGFVLTLLLAVPVLIRCWVYINTVYFAAGCLAALLALFPHEPVSYTHLPLFSTEVYSNNFYIAEEDYEAPDDKYLKGDAAQ